MVPPLRLNKSRGLTMTHKDLAPRTSQLSSSSLGLCALLSLCSLGCPGCLLLQDTLLQSLAMLTSGKALSALVKICTTASTLTIFTLPFIGTLPYFFLSRISSIVIFKIQYKIYIIYSPSLTLICP